MTRRSRLPEISESSGIRLKSPVGLLLKALRAIRMTSSSGRSEATRAAITEPMLVPPT